MLLGDAERPLYGIILNGPYPKPPYHNAGQFNKPFLPYRPPVQPSRPHPAPFVKPPAPYYPTPSFYPAPPPPPSSPSVPYQPVYNVPSSFKPDPYRPEPVRPAPAPEPYRPPAAPAPEPYRPPVRPAPYRPPSTHRPHRPNYPIPTSFDNKPWSPIPISATYVLDPAVQLNELDGYPWTQELRENDDKEEEIADKIPELLFRDKLPSKSLAQQHAGANDINFSPNPERN